MSEIAIRRAEESDLPALLDIYNHYVLNSAATFDIEPRTLDQRREWFAQFSPSGKYRCFSAVMDGAVVGWASSARFKERAAYDTTIETSIYLAPHAAGRGLGRALYTALFDALAREDIHRIFGGVTLPNETSVRLHEGMGFRRVGVQPEVGRKFGRFWDVGLFFKDMN